MESITSLLAIALAAILVNNFVLSQFLGICPFMGVSKKVETALGMGMAVTFVMGVASAVNWPINEFCWTSSRPGLYADRHLHPGHRLPGSVRGDVPAEVHARSV